MTDTLQSIYLSAKRFFSGTLISRFSGLLRDSALAFFFGTQPALAVFMLSFRLSHLFRRLFGEGALQTAFIPAFESLRHQEPKRAFLFFRDLIWTLTLFLIALILLIEAGLGICLYTLEWSSSNQQILILTSLLLPSLLFICLYGLNASLLQCEKFYFIPSVAPAAFNGIWILSLFFLSTLPITYAMQGLALAVVGACFFQWLVTYPKVRFILNKNLTLSFLTYPVFLSPDVKSILKPLGLGIIGVAASQINNTIDMFFARYAQSNGPALLWYAIRIQQLPLALFGIALAGALLPPLARAKKAKQWQQYHQFLYDALQHTWNFMLPFTFFLLLAGDVCINLLYGYGEFSTNSIKETNFCLAGYTAGLIPTALILILAPACYSQQAYSLPAFASIGSVFLNIILNSLFIFGLRWSCLSVALATSLSAWINVFLLRFVLFHYYNIKIAAIFKGDLTYTLLGFSSGLTMLAFRFYFIPFDFFELDQLILIDRLKIMIFLIFLALLPYGLFFSLKKLKLYLGYSSQIKESSCMNND